MLLFSLTAAALLLLMDESELKSVTLLLTRYHTIQHCLGLLNEKLGILLAQGASKMDSPQQY